MEPDKQSDSVKQTPTFLNLSRHDLLKSKQSEKLCAMSQAQHMITPMLMLAKDGDDEAIRVSVVLEERHDRPPVKLIATSQKKHKRQPPESKTNEAISLCHDRKNRKKVKRCDYNGCEKTFTWQAHLKYHMLTHTGARPFLCPIENCGKTFLTHQRLKTHQRVHTGEKPFVCTEDTCQKAFATAGNLKNHQRLHTGEKPFVCPIATCAARFAELSSLKKHKLVHTGNKPYDCQLCGRTFSQVSSRNVHMKRHLLAKEVDGSPVKGHLAVFNNGLNKRLDFDDAVLVIGQNEDDLFCCQETVEFSHSVTEVQMLMIPDHVVPDHVTIPDHVVPDHVTIPDHVVTVTTDDSDCRTHTASSEICEPAVPLRDAVLETSSATSVKQSEPTNTGTLLHPNPLESGTTSSTSTGGKNDSMDPMMEDDV